MSDPNIQNPGYPQYSGMIRKLVIGFGNLFNNIPLVRYNPDGTINNSMIVPLTYASKEKYVTRLNGDPDLVQKTQITLPRMSFDMEGMTYDPTRKLNNYITTNYNSGVAGVGISQHLPVPYNFDFGLYLYVRNIEDGSQIIEYILPNFTPDYTIAINVNPALGQVKNIPIILNSVDYEVDYEGDSLSSTRMVLWTLKFTLKGYIYPPSVEQKIITDSIITVIDGDQLLPSQTLTFNMANTGFGYYKTNELVYQGFSLDAATATGSVVSYSNTTNQLTVIGINGSFTTNTVVHGFDSGAEFSIINYSSSNGVYFIANSYINPANTASNTGFNIITNVTEFN